MAQNREQNIVVTPAGVAKFPRLNTPDTKFDAAGQYKVTLVLNEADKGVEDFLNAIREVESKAIADAQKAAKKGKRIKEAESVIKQALDEDCNEVEGQYEITAKMKASGTRKDGSAWERKPAIYDSEGKPTKANVGGGSILKLSIDAQPYYTPSLGAGCTLRLEGVQVLDLKAFSGGRTAEALGFGKEDGYVDNGEDAAGSDGSNDSADDEDADTDAESDDADDSEEDAKPAKGKGAKAAKPTKAVNGKAAKKVHRDF